MATKHEIAAGIAKSWLGAYGSKEAINVVEDVVNILEICHNFRDREGLPSFTADELGDAIADYVVEAYSTPVEFEDVQPTREPSPDGIGTGSAGG